MAATPQLSLESVTRVRESRTIFSNPLANDLQKLQQFLNSLAAKVESLAADVPSDTPVSPTIFSDFSIPAPPEFRNDGAMDVAMEALALASGGGTVAPSPQIIFCTQSTFPTLSGVPANTFIAVTDYAHLIYWDGITPVFFGDNPGGISLWEVDPGVGYHLYDGATVNYLKADGTLGSISLPDLTSSGALAAFLEGGSPNSGPTAAAAPALAMNSYTPSGSVSAQILVGTPAALTTAAATPVGAVNAITQIAGSGSSYTPSGIVTTGSLIGDSATLTGTISATGEPRKIIRRPYFRQ